MSSSSMTPEDLRAAAEVHSELGPAYRDAVVDSFLDKVGAEIDARVDARLADARRADPRMAPIQATAPPDKPAADNSLRLAIVSLVLGIPISAIAVGAGRNPAGLVGLIVVWAAITAINVAYSLHHRPRP